VAIGEAGCIPCAHSLIGDSFTRAERPRAVARFMLGGPLSVVIGYFLAGWLNEFYGWRITFVMLGLPGVVLAVVAWRTLAEPRLAQRIADRPPSEPGLREVWITLFATATFRNLLLCFSVSSFFSYGISKWQPAFFIRSHGLQTGELGTWFTFIYGLGGLIGTYVGGEWAARRARRDERRQLSAMAAVYASSAFLLTLTFLSASYSISFALMALVAIAGAATNGPMFGTIQTLVPPRMRAMSIAMVYLFANLIGMGLGPLAVGMLSDMFRPWAGEESLRYALVVLCPGYLWGAWHCWRASRTVMLDVKSAEANEARLRGAVSASCG
jgi:MFS transporter, Spinster family, sphingosine-1-phosphate transporter